MGFARFNFFLYNQMNMIQRALKILQTCFSHSWGGLEIHTLNACLRLLKRGHSVKLACCSQSRLEQEAKTHAVETIPLNVSGYFHPVIIYQLSRLLRETAIDILHCQLSKDLATVVPAAIASKRRIPIFLSKRMGSFIQKRDFFHRFTYSRLEYVLAISNLIRQNVIETTPISSDRVITVHEAVNTEMFSLEKVDRYRVRQEFAIPDNYILIGFVGRFSPGKGHEDFLNAAAILNQKYPHIHFLIVGEASRGETDYELRIRRMVDELHLHNCVTFAGFRTDIPEVMAAFDIFVFPSHAEAFGAVLIEAMAMERPVVSTNCDGVLDIVVDGETGIYVNPKSPHELAQAISYLIENPSLRSRLGKAGRSRVEELFDEKKQMMKIETLYYGALNKNRS